MAMEVAQQVNVLEGQHKGPEVDGRGDTDSEKLSCDLWDAHSQSTS